MDEFDPPPRGCTLTSQYTPGGPAGPELLGVHAGNSVPPPHDGEDTVPIPICGHFLDVPAAGSFQILRPAQLPQQL